MNDSLPVLEVKNLTITFPIDEDDKKPKQVVKNISFTLKKGEILGIVGESGSGKSITSLAIMGLIPPSGNIDPASEINCHFIESELKSLGLTSNPSLINLLTLNKTQKTQYRGGKIAMIFQEPMSAFNPVYTIGFQLIEAITLHQNITKKQAKVQAIDLLRQVQLLDTKKLKNEDLDYIKQGEKLLNKYPHEFSGGQLQRVMIAMAISCDPSILIADEPTTALDVTTQKEILDLLKNLCKIHRDMSMIFISHDLGVINQIADAVLVMYQGVKREFKEVTPESHQSVFASPATDPYTRGLLACRPRLNHKLTLLPIVSDFMEVQKDEKGEIVEIKSKKPDMSRYQSISLQEEEKRYQQLTDPQKSQIILSVKDLSVTYGKAGFWSQQKPKIAVNNISFEVYKEETLGLVGESGCGKSTLARAILRLIHSQGKIDFYDQEEEKYVTLSNYKLADARLRDLRSKIQIIFQNPYNSLNPRMTIGAAIIEPMIIHNKFGKNREEEARHLLDKVRLDESYFNRYPHELSGGQRQRVCMARALALKPSLIICDESVSALDVSVQAEVLNLLKQLQKDEKLTYIFISHDLSVVRFMSDRIMVMENGEAVEKGTVRPAYEIIERNKIDPYTEKLLDSIPDFPDDIAS